MTLAIIAACWCLGACILAPVVGRAIKTARKEALKAELMRRRRPQHQIRVA